MSLVVCEEGHETVAYEARGGFGSRTNKCPMCGLCQLLTNTERDRDSQKERAEDAEESIKTIIAERDEFEKMSVKSVIAVRDALDEAEKIAAANGSAWEVVEELRRRA